MLRQLGYLNARGVDGLPELVAAARRPGVSGVELGDIFATLAQTADGSLDVVVMFDVIEHFTKAELLLLVDHLFRVLKPAGRWIIHRPNAAGPFGGATSLGDFTHEVSFTRVSIDQLLRASGLSRIECFEDRPTPHGLKSII